MGKKNHATWTEAKKRCRLNQADIKMAKELGMKPKSLLKSIPSPDEPWKAPVKIWVRDLYEMKFDKVLTNQVKQSTHKKTSHITDDELPF